MKAVAFDVGETLVDETRMWSDVADAVGIPRFTFFGVLGGLVARGEHHRRVFDVLGVERPSSYGFAAEDLYADARPCLAELRRRGYVLAAVGNTGTQVEAMFGDLVDVVGSSERWGVEKPCPGFFHRLADELGARPAEIAHVGDRVDNDILPAVDAGMVAVHVRRGPWGYLQAGGERAHARIESLRELPEALDGV